MKRGQWKVILLFLLPALTLYVVFVALPYLQAIRTSTWQWRGVTPEGTPIGLDNYTKLLADDTFWNALFHNALLLAVLPATIVSLSLGLAALLSRGSRGVGVFAFVFFLPQVVATALIGVLWSFIYHPRIGIVNQGLEAVGLGPLQRVWLGDPSTSLWAIAVVITWAVVGFYTIYFRAAIAGIPIELYEAAALDGASEWRLFRRITVPLLSAAIQTAVVTLVIISFGAFDVVQVMTAGGPNKSSDVLSTFLYRTAFRGSQYGYAAAIGVVLLLLTLVAAGASALIRRREQVEF